MSIIWKSKGKHKKKVVGWSKDASLSFIVAKVRGGWEIRVYKYYVSGRPDTTLKCTTSKLDAMALAETWGALQ